MRSALLPLAAAALLAAAPGAAAQAPTTAFEQRNGAAWTTHAEEQQFLAAVDAQSPRARLTEIGKTKQGRPVQLVELGAPGPAGAAAARNRPTALMVCSQHGNEPSGREACLRFLRDLAFTSDAGLVALLERTTFLFVPAANPDGRNANSRENTDGVDINRDHVGLDTPEAKAMAAVVRDWQPDVALDLHEYGPSMPVIYDDALLWLHPRNLNTDKAVHDLALKLGRDYLVPAAEAAGYTTDEYGQYEVADNDVYQSAGDGDEGIMRNAMGLRHVLGILVETRVDADVRQSPMEPLQNAQVQRRRVDSHMSMLRGLLRFMAERGEETSRVTAAAARGKAHEGAFQTAPVYFDGADNQEPSAENTVNPPPCGYRLTDEQVAKLGPRLDLHGIRWSRVDIGPFVPLSQAAEPIIPLLLDARGSRNVVEAAPLGSGCAKYDVKPDGGSAASRGGPAAGGSPPAGGSPALRPTAPRCSSRRTVLMRLPRRRGKALRTVVTANGRRVRVRRGLAVVSLARARGTVKVRITQRVRVRGKTRTFRVTRTLRVCKR